MKVAEIVAMVAAEGITLTAGPDGTIEYTGPSEAIQRWLPTLKDHKAEIAAVLQAPLVSGPFPDDLVSCQRCRHLNDRDVCRVAGSTDGPVGTVRGYRPALDVLRRCETFWPRYLH